MTQNRDSVVDIRKYPNRRYYDTSRSRHVTLEEIYELICQGQDVRVTDTKSGQDITAKVLAQIILEHDPPKLDVFPVQLLHRLIRSNEQLVHDFVDKYFNQALSAFLASQKQFEQYLRQSIGLQSPASMGSQWVQAMMGPFAQAFMAKGPSGDAEDEGEADRPAADTTADPPRDGLHRQVEDLRREIAALRSQIGSSRRRRTDRAAD